MVAADLRVDVLAEDLTHFNFVRRWLMEEGVDARKIRSLGIAAGRLAGEQYVRNHYANEVRDFRSKAQERVALVVVIDADLMETKARTEQLARALEQARGNDERIVHVIPKRHIETWIHALEGEPGIDETTKYKRPNEKPASCDKAGPAYAAFLRTEPAPGTLPSLIASRTEAARLK
jgi:hypothetical protein